MSPVLMCKYKYECRVKLETEITSDMGGRSWDVFQVAAAVWPPQLNGEHCWRCRISQKPRRYLHCTRYTAPVCTAPNIELVIATIPGVRSMFGWLFYVPQSYSESCQTNCTNLTLLMCSVAMRINWWRPGGMSVWGAGRHRTVQF